MVPITESQKVPVFKNGFSHGAGIHNRKGGVLRLKWIWERGPTSTSDLTSSHFSREGFWLHLEDVGQAGSRGPNQPSIQCDRLGTLTNP